MTINKKKLKTINKIYKYKENKITLDVHIYSKVSYIWHSQSTKKFNKKLDKIKALT